MSSSQPNPNEPQIMKRIGQGKFSVYKYYDPQLNTYCACKLYPFRSQGQYEKEQEIISKLSHANIIKYLGILTNQKKNTSWGILTEFAEYGDLFDITLNGFLNSEVLIRTYFHQLIDGLKYLYSEGIAHLDLKLENLVMTADFTLKIIDFDQAQNADDKKIQSGGTVGFRAPEVIDGTCTNLCAADIYSAGVILYAFVAREQPFPDNLIGSVDYYIFRTDNENYWNNKANRLQNHNHLFINNDFKALLNGMLEFDAEKRFTLKDVQESNWYNGPIFDEEGLRTVMKEQLMSST